MSLPRFFKVFNDDAKDPERFDLVTVGPSPKFPGLTAFSAFRSSTLEYVSDPDRCDIVYEPAYDVSVKFGCEQNIYYHNSNEHPLGVTAEVTTDSVDVWLKDYSHLLISGKPHKTFVEIDFDTAMSEDFRMLYFKDACDAYGKLSPQTSHAKPLLTSSELLERSYGHSAYYYFYLNHLKTRYFNAEMKDD